MSVRPTPVTASALSVTLGEEFESLNLLDLDVEILNQRLELASLLPEVIVCNGNCGGNTCSCNGYVDCGCYGAYCNINFF